MTAPDPDTILDVLRRLLPDGAALHEPRFAGNEWAYVKECLDTGWVSTAGAFVPRFEKMLADITGAKHVIATNTGTAALHAAFLTLGVGAGDEVIVPSLTFAATANAVAHAGAVPHFAEAETTTLGVDPERLRKHLGDTLRVGNGGPINKATGRPVKAIVCVHVFGHPARVDALCEVAGDFDLPLVEDAAESLGSTYRGRHTGTFGRMGTLSFNGNKTVTTGAGGAILTDDDALAAAARHLTTTAKRAHAWEYDHDQVGYNYRLPNINAALGCAQLELLDDFIARKRRLAAAYVEAFADVPGVSVLTEPAEAFSNYWLNALLLDTPDRSALHGLLAAAHAAGFGLRPAWRPMHELPMYRDCPRMAMETTEALAARIVNLPSGPGLEIGTEAGSGHA